MITMSDLPRRREKRPNVFDNAPQRKSPAEMGLTNGIWSGRRCFIIGGGASLTGFNWEILRGELTIAINRAFEKLDPTIFYTMDARFWAWLEEGKFGEDQAERFRTYSKGYKCLLNQNGMLRYPEDIVALNRLKEWSTDLGKGIFSATNSGLGALNLACLLGASPIYMLGFDMKGDGKGNQKWWHNGYPTLQSEDVYAGFKREFELIRPFTQDKKIINLNPDSGLKEFELGTIDDLVFDRKPIIISYYTPAYAEEAEKLIDSLKPLGYETDIVAVNSLGSWQRNTQYKAIFIREMLNKHKHPVIFVDADATVERYFNTDFLNGYDFAAHLRNGNELLSGTLYFGYTRNALTLIDLWIDVNDANPDIWDQRNLRTATLVAPELKSAVLGPEYCAIFDGMPEAGEKPYIMQWQASRRLKNANH